MLISLYTVVLTATLTAFLASIIYIVVLHKMYKREVKEIENVYFNNETKQLAILYTNGEFEIKNVLEYE